jgi:hypothetical protein
MWKEALVAYFKMPSWHLPEMPKKTTKNLRVVRVPAKIRTGHQSEKLHP